MDCSDQSFIGIKENTILNIAHLAQNHIGIFIRLSLAGIDGFSIFLIIDFVLILRGLRRYDHAAHTTIKGYQMLACALTENNIDIQVTIGAFSGCGTDRLDLVASICERV